MAGPQNLTGVFIHGLQKASIIPIKKIIPVKNSSSVNTFECKLVKDLPFYFAIPAEVIKPTDVTANVNSILISDGRAFGGPVSATVKILKSPVYFILRGDGSGHPTLAFRVSPEHDNIRRGGSSFKT
ncbi:hypothetical protein D3C87_1754270 [compost metagenome]